MMKGGTDPAIAGTLLITAAAVPPRKLSKPNQSLSVMRFPRTQSISAYISRMQERRSLENLQEFLSPFRLPRPLKIELAGCAEKLMPNIW